MAGDLVLRGGRVVPMAGPAPRRGPEASAPLAVIEDGAVAVVGGRIAYVGPDADLPGELRSLPSVAANGRVVLPGLVDCHTHLPFAAWRADEYAERLGGATYADQQRRPDRLKGIARSAAQLAAAPAGAQHAVWRGTLGEAAAAGTTTIEMKSGYGGDRAGEMRSLEVMEALRAEGPQGTVRTGLFLHALPRHAGRAEWLEEVLGSLLPAALGKGLLDGVDAFVEEVAFRLDEAAALLQAGQAAGLATHLHAEQLAASGATAWAVAHGVTSVDHLDHLDAAGVRALGRGQTVAVLLPGATFLAGHGRVPPVRGLLDAGAPVALATDLNPGTSPVASLPEVAALACRAWDMPIAAAVAALTVNAAAALGLGQEVGRLAPGMRGDVVVLDGDDPALLAYRLGHPAVALTVARGRVVARDGQALDPGANAS